MKAHINLREEADLLVLIADLLEERNRVMRSRPYAFCIKFLVHVLPDNVAQCVPANTWNVCADAVTDLLQRHRVLAQSAKLRCGQVNVSCRASMHFVSIKYKWFRAMPLTLGALYFDDAFAQSFLSFINRQFFGGE